MMHYLSSDHVPTVGIHRLKEYVLAWSPPSDHDRTTRSPSSSPRRPTQRHRAIPQRRQSGNRFVDRPPRTERRPAPHLRSIRAQFRGHSESPRPHACPMWSGYAGIDDDGSTSVLWRAPRPALRCSNLKGACATRFLDEDEAGSGFLTENEEADRAVHTSSAIHGESQGGGDEVVATPWTGSGTTTGAWGKLAGIYTRSTGQACRRRSGIWGRNCGEDDELLCLLGYLAQHDVSGRAEVAGPYRSPIEDLGGVGGRVADSVRRLRELRAESELLTRIGTETTKKGEEIEMTGRSHHPVTRRRTWEGLSRGPGRPVSARRGVKLGRSGGNPVLGRIGCSWPSYVLFPFFFCFYFLFSFYLQFFWFQILNANLKCKLKLILIMHIGHIQLWWCYLIIILFYIGYYFLLSSNPLLIIILFYLFFSFILSLF
jgi:hypothetical protein